MSGITIGSVKFTVKVIINILGVSQQGAILPTWCCEVTWMLGPLWVVVPKAYLACLPSQNVFRLWQRGFAWHVPSALPSLSFVWELVVKSCIGSSFTFTLIAARCMNSSQPMAKYFFFQCHAYKTYLYEYIPYLCVHIYTQSTDVKRHYVCKFIHAVEVY